MTFRRSPSILGLALVLVAGVAGAQQPSPRADRPHAGEMRGGRGMNGGGPGRAMLRGISLTDAQKERLRAIDQKYRSEGQAARAAMRPAMEEGRAARQRGDSATARRAWQGTDAQRRQMAALQERRLAEVRGVLTAEQQQRFDANRSEMQARMRERGAGGRDGHGRGGRRGGRGRAG
jgi:Spy/CpxP family protein refolding chaperone